MQGGLLEGSLEFFFSHLLCLLFLTPFPVLLAVSLPVIPSVDFSQLKHQLAEGD